jgi:hypothetical protein
MLVLRQRQLYKTLTSSVKRIPAEQLSKEKIQEMKLPYFCEMQTFLIQNTFPAHCTV